MKTRGARRVEVERVVGDGGVRPAIGSANRASTRDVGPLDARIGQQLDPRPVDERVVVGPGEGQGAVGQLGRERRLHLAERRQVVRVEADDEAVRHERAIGRGQALRLHRALDPPLQLDGLQAGSEQASGWSLEEAFEEPLDGGQRLAWSVAELTRGSPSVGPTPPTTPDHPPGAPVHTSQGHWKGRGILSTLFVRIRPFELSSARSGGPMAEVLTESFCERCGTRYTFESAQPRVKRLKGVKVLSRGLKNFVLSDDSSLDEAMAAARSDTDREVTAQQLDAFHQTFNFCMTCRQYTCANCWNEAEGALPDVCAAPRPRDPAGARSRTWTRSGLVAARRGRWPRTATATATTTTHDAAGQRCRRRRRSASEPGRRSTDLATPEATTLDRSRSSTTSSRSTPPPGWPP